MKKIVSFILTLAMLLSSSAYLLPAGANDYDSSKVFRDVSAKAWFKADVDFVASRGIMGGSGQADTFKPSDFSTRAMLAVILHRLEGEPEANAKAPFTDLKQKWYAAAAHWAYESGVVKGSSETTFNPNGNVTRQELVTMIHRYAEFCGLDVSERKDASEFPDSGKVAKWALESVEWALAAGLINGRKEGAETLLAPKGNTKRSELAAILHRFITKLEREGKNVDPLYGKVTALGKASLCEEHKAALHLQLGPIGTVTEAGLGAFILSYMGLDTSIYSVSFKSGAIESFNEKYAKTGAGEGVLIPVSFTVNNNRTLGSEASLDSFPLWVVRNDWYTVPREIPCSFDRISDEEIAAEISEFDSLYVCPEHKCVHIEAEKLTEDSFKEAIIGYMSRGAQVYKVRLSGNGFASLKSDFDSLSYGETTAAHDVTFAISNELIKKELGYESVTEEITVKFSVMKAEETVCHAPECPYAKAAKSTELFLKKYVCNEHGKVHVTLSSGDGASISQMEALVAEALDLGRAYTVKLDSAAFAEGKVKVKLKSILGYEMDGVEFTPVYTVDASCEKAAKLTLCENDRDAYKLIVHDGYHSNLGSWNHGQTSSGWIIDNRADDAIRHGVINDVSIFNSSQVIRELNTTAKGVIDHRCSITVTDGFDGAVLDFRSEDGESVVRLETVDGKWKLLTPDGRYETVFDGAGEKKFVFGFKIDLYENTVRIIINDVNCGIFPLATAGVNSNIRTFRFASTDEARISYTLGLCEAYVNYSLAEIFSKDSHYSTLPAEWEYTGASIVPNTGITHDSRVYDEYLSIAENGRVKKTFDPTDGKVIAQFAILPAVNGCDTEYVLAGEGDPLLRVTADETSFYVNGKKAYDYVKNVWYYFYLICDTSTGKVQLRINGIDRGEFALPSLGVPFDTVTVTNSGNDVIYDAFYVYGQVEHSDYVPKPVKPEGGEAYDVGINVCSLWQNGFHHGWASITPYDDIRPVLGYYDEGSPESADWEIKYLVEHGVDFQAFCFYTCQGTGAVTTGNGMHLEDGYKHARYSDMMKYCLIWETMNATKPADLNAWKTYFVPFLIEHHFKDPRYMTVENKLIFPSFGSYMAGNGYGTGDWSGEDIKEALDYLDEQVKLLGFDGMAYMDVDWGRREGHKENGIESIFSYNHGGDGATFEGNKTRIETLKKSCEDLGLYYVPTVSTGFNSIGWRQNRSPLIGIEDFREINKWVRDEYLTSSSNAPKWAENLVWMSTWNEYGEGTYMMPSEGLHGFGYLDVIRETYTSEKADESLNTIPTAAQLERINRLYPQHMRLLRAEEYELYTNGIYDPIPQYEAETETVKEVSFSRDLISAAENLTVYGGVIVNDSDKYGKVVLSLDGDYDITRCYAAEITAEAPSGKTLPLFYGNADDGKFKVLTTVMDTGYGRSMDYGIEIDGAAGNAVQITLPAGSKLYAVRVLVKVSENFGYKLTIDGQTMSPKVLPRLSPRGDLLVGFDTILADLHPYGMFTEWDADRGRMTLSFQGDVFEFTVGSAFYTLNGVRYCLGYEIYKTDNVPMIPLNVVMERLGCKVDYSDLRNAVVTK